jgi:thioredoxin 2
MSVLTADDRGVLVACPSCGRTNRRRFEHLTSTLRCAQCQAALSDVSVPVDASTAAVFARLVGGSPIPVVVDFWAPWCGPCRMMAPELDRLASMTAGQLVIAKVNTDLAPDLGEQHRIRSIPTLAVFLNGSEVARTSGAMPAEQLRTFVTEAIARRV